MPSFITSHAPDVGAVRSTSHSKSPQDETEDRLLYALGDRQWDIPGLRTHLETIVPEHDVMDAYVVDRELARYRGS